MNRYMIAAALALALALACDSKPSDTSAPGPMADAAYINWINHGLVRTSNLDKLPAGCAGDMAAFCEVATEAICDGATLTVNDRTPPAQDGTTVQTCHWTCTHRLPDGTPVPPGFVNPASFTFVVNYDGFGVPRGSSSTFSVCE